MSVRRLDPVQPDSFEFTAENLKWAEHTIAKYPEGKQASAVISLLWRAQEQNGGWLSEPSIRVVADMLDMAEIRVLEIATFYTMFNLRPVGKYFVQLCGTTPCWLRGAEDLKKVCHEVIGPPGYITEDGLFSWVEVECLGACVNAPMVQINKDYYEDLMAKSFEKLLNDLRNGKDVNPGPQVKRQFSCPIGGPTTLLDTGSGGSVNGHGNGKHADAQTDGPKRSAAGDAVTESPTGADGSEHLAIGDVTEGTQPEALEKARDEVADDLKQISGIGPKLEKVLNELGIFHFDQIAGWSEDNVTWIDTFLKFKGRAERENWIKQATVLAKGEETESSRRYKEDEAEEDG